MIAPEEQDKVAGLIRDFSNKIAEVWAEPMGGDETEEIAEKVLRQLNEDNGNLGKGE